ncbi:hypothetical protein [Brucella intermedia]|uniref:hypothetical protein n=1 Tax=Brucella intermedia TaxID=94625 RepID=UPI0023609AEB|nr:hypothetical protein [Brucella intermedia]
MKIIAWAAGVLFAVWLTAFTLIKWSDLGCSQNWTICAHETGIWFRKLVLLEWASKWQTLLAGLGAVVGGAFVLWAAKTEISESRKDAIVRTNQQLSQEMFVAFQTLLKALRSWQTNPDVRSVYLDQSMTAIASITKCCPQLATELSVLLTRVRLTHSTSSIDAAKLQAYAALVVTIANILQRATRQTTPLQASDVGMNKATVVDISDKSDIPLHEFESILVYCTPD